MPATTTPVLDHYELPPPTSHTLDWADLQIIDLSEAHTAEGCLKLVPVVRDAMTKTGFFYVVNHGYTPQQTSRIFDIANVPFDRVSPEEKQLYEGQPKKTGSYQGYKLRAYWHVDNGIRDQIENYNINRDTTKRNHPEPLRSFLPEISEFAKFNHINVLYLILKLLAMGLELPEDTFIKQHGFQSKGETYVRFMKYFPRSIEDEEKSNNVWLKGHTDFGSITVLWSQPVSALQILSSDGRWRWVKHVENALVINAGDCLEFLSGGFYKATIHRVIQPPPDQQSYKRLGVFYFAIPDDDVELRPCLASSVLRRLGSNDRFKQQNVDAASVEVWRKARTAAYGQSTLIAGNEDHVEEEIINGIVVKHYK